MHPDLCFTLMQISVLLSHNMAAIRCVFQTLPTLHTLKNLDNMMDKLQQLPD